MIRRTRSFKAVGDPAFPGAIACLASVGDGRHALALDDMGVLMRVDVEAGTMLGRAVGHSDDEGETDDDDDDEGAEWTFDAFAIVGRRVVAVCSDSIELFDLELRAIDSFARDAPNARAIVGHPAGDRVAILDDKGIEIWNLDDGERLLRFDVARRADAELATDVTGKWLYAFDREGFERRAWDTGEEESTDIYKAECVCPLPDGRVLVASGPEIEMWTADLDDECELSFVPKTSGSCQDIALIDEHRVVAVHYGGSISVFDLATGRVLATSAEDKTFDPQRVAVMSPTRFAVAPRERDGSIEIWDIDDEPSEDVAGLGFAYLLAAGDDQVAAIASGGGSLAFDLANAAHPLGPLTCGGRAFYADADVVLVGDSSRITRVDRATGATLSSIYSHSLDDAGPYLDVARGGGLLAGTVEDKQHIDLIDLRARDDKWHRFEQAADIAAVAFDDRAEHVLASLVDGRIAVWTIEGAPVRTMACVPCRRIVVGTDWFATIGADRHVATFALATGAALATLPAAYTYVAAVAGVLVTADVHGEIVRWDPQRAERLDAWAAGETRSVVATRSGHVVWLDRRGELHYRGGR